MVVSVEKYDQVKLERLKSILEDAQSAGSPEYFEVYVNGWKVVKKTNDVSRFDKYEEHMDETTEKVRVVLYGDSENSRKGRDHIFMVKEPVVKPLDGLEIADKIKEGVAEGVALERRNWESELTKRDLEVAKKQLQEAEEYIDQLQDQLKESQGKKIQLGSVNLIDAASLMFEGIIRRNPQFLLKIPGGEALAGMIVDDNKERNLLQHKNTSADTQVSFSKAKDAPLTDEEKRYMQVIEQMEEHFTPEELIKVMQIIQKLSEDKKSISVVAELLNIHK